VAHETKRRQPAAEPGAAEARATPAPAPAAPVPGGIAEHAALLAPGALPVAGQRAIAARLARAHGNAHLQRALGARVVARVPVADAYKAVEDAASGLGTDEDGIYQAIRTCDDRAALKGRIKSIIEDELSGFELWKAQLLLEYGPEAGWPAGLEAIFKACAGAGTDEQAIIDTLNALSIAETGALAKVPRLMGVLDGELSGFDRMRVRLLLKYGPTTGWPKGLTEVIAACEGLGTDEQRIFRALGGLTEAEATALAAVDGVLALLDDELSGAELQAAKDYLSGAYAKRIAAHKANVAALAALVPVWRADPDPVIKNTADWLFPATGPARLHIHVLTATHDSVARAKEHGATGVAYFGMDTDYPGDGATYDADVRSKRGIEFADAIVIGTHNGDNIQIMEPAAKAASEILAVLVHELQHEADRHEDEHDWQKDFKSPEESWVRYKTEFRAYWVDARIGGSDAAGSAAAPFDNARQKGVFDHLYKDYAEWLKPNYDGDKDVHGKKFKDLVHGYAKPEGVNLRNSPRIDDLYTAAGKCSPSDTDTTKQPLAGLLTAAGALNADDLGYVNSPEARALQDRLRDQLAKSAFDAVALALGSPAWSAVNIAPARRAILAAGRGLGTDEAAMYAAIAAASPAERAAMAADPVIMSELDDELSGKDLWRARMYLKHGPKDKWPKEVLEEDAR
jgi:hypothetical protein